MADLPKGDAAFSPRRTSPPPRQPRRGSFVLERDGDSIRPESFMLDTPRFIKNLFREGNHQRGLDADKLDSHHASDFGLLAGDNTWTGDNHFTGGVGITGTAGARADITADNVASPADFQLPNIANATLAAFTTLPAADNYFVTSQGTAGNQEAISPAAALTLIGAQPLDTQLTSLAALSYAGNTLKVVRVNAGETDFELATISAATGDVVGPAGATDNAVARYDSTTGKLIQDSVVLIGDTGDATGFGNIDTSSRLRSTTDTGTNILLFSNSFSQSAMAFHVDSGVQALRLVYDGTGTPYRQLQVATGNEPGGVPAVAALGDTNTGMGFPAADTVSLLVNGLSELVVATTGVDIPTQLTAAGLIYPTADGAAGEAIVTDGLGNLSFAAAGSGTVTNAAAITDNALVRGDGGANGVQDSNIIIDDNDDVTGMGSLSMDGALDVGAGTVTVAADQNDYAGIDGQVVFNADVTGADRTITGLSGGVEGDLKFIYVRPSSSFNLLLANQSGSSSAGNRFNTGTGLAFTIAPGTGAWLVCSHNGTNTEWTVKGCADRIPTFGSGAPSHDAPLGSLYFDTSGTNVYFCTFASPGAWARVAKFTDITAANVGLGNVTNESKATMFTNPVFTGTVTIPDNALAIADTSGLQTALDAKAPLASPTFTGTVTLPTTQFAQNQALQFVLENRTDDPVSPAVGQMWFRTDL